MKEALKSLASLKLTITLLALAFLLIYAGTWAQVDTGIWTVQKKYFHSFWVWVDLQVFLPRPDPGQTGIPGGFPLPGGYTIGALMLLNLLAAHAIRFKLELRRTGIILTHFGLILLLIGELLTSLLAVESHMEIDQGETVSYSEDSRFGELVLIDPSSPDRDTVVAFSQSALREGNVLRHSLLPFEVRVDTYAANSELLGPRQAPPGSAAKATAGPGQGVVLKPVAPSAGTDNAIDMASAYVTLTAGGRTLGTWLVSYNFEEPQDVTVDGRTWRMALRFRRYYKPYTMHLVKFSHDRYLGTEVPKNFSSRVRLVDPEARVDREVLIRMNEPLRYRGETYYQASFRPGDRTTILQVVRNPAWTMPYVACAIGGIGMLVHFGILLAGFLKAQGRKAEAVAPGGAVMKPDEDAVPLRARLLTAPVVFPAIALALGIAWVGSALRPPPPAAAGDYDLAEFGKIPVTFDGRTLPVDTLARSVLQAISGRQGTRAPVAGTAPADWSRVPYEEWKPVPAVRWLADVMAGTERADAYRVFRIDNPELLGLLGLNDDRKPRLYSFGEVMERRDKLEEQVARMRDIEGRDRDPFQQKVADLYQKLQAHAQLTNYERLYLVPPLAAGEEWRPIGTFMSRDGSAPEHPAATSLLVMLSSFHHGLPAEFNAELAIYRSLLREKLPRETKTARFEEFFNRFDPFYRSQVLYVMVFVLGCAAWLGWTRPFGRAAFVLLLLSLAVHTFGLAARISISGRPPVTNLYSSAVFIAWAVVVLAVCLEWYYRNVIASVTSAAAGFTSLLVAHHLAGDGDTMRQMQAVLDTNFWLATHVVAITLGYAAVFLAGVLAIVYIGMGILTPWLTAARPGRTPENTPSKVLPRMVYAILCFAMLFSFVGTILGGIWADQSWGRFWGWDPKENGAALIVLWVAIVLHARWSGLARDRGIMVLAVFGNVVTSWSWFGTNMMGVGLHAYGFMESAMFWLLAFVASQLLVIMAGNLPLRLWRSFRPTSDARAT